MGMLAGRGGLRFVAIILLSSIHFVADERDYS